MKLRALSSVAASLVFLLLATPGCSSDSSSGGGGVLSVSEEQYAGLFAQGVCSGFYQCDCPPSDVYPFADQAECEAMFTESTGNAQERYRADGLTFDSECATRRVNSFRGNVCVDEVWDHTACGSCAVYHGSAAQGAPCTLDECGRGLACIGGECVDPCDRVAEGGACASTVNKCQSGFTCEGDFDGEGTCALALGEGEACSDGAGCGEDLRCYDGACAKVALPGEGCMDRPCAYTECVGGKCATAPLGLPNVCDLY